MVERGPATAKSETGKLRERATPRETGYTLSLSNERTNGDAIVRGEFDGNYNPPLPPPLDFNVSVCATAAVSARMR